MNSRNIGSTLTCVTLCLILIYIVTLIYNISNKHPWGQETEIINKSELTATIGHIMHQTTDVVVLDGDTIRGDIHLGLGVVLDDTTIRASNYDACETSKHRQTVTISDNEIQTGKKAKACFEKLCSEGRVLIELEHDAKHGMGKKDIYGRVLAKIYVVDKSSNVIDMEEYMTTNGFIRTGSN